MGPHGDDSTATAGGDSWQNHAVIDTGLDEVSLSVPAHVAYARIVRLAAASLAVNQGMSFGEIDDLRSVVDGAVGILLDVEGGTDDDSLEIIYRFSAGKFEMTIQRTGTGTLHRSVIDNFVDSCSTLIDGFEIRESDRWLRIRKTPAGDT